MPEPEPEPEPEPDVLLPRVAVAAFYEEGVFGTISLSQFDQALNQFGLATAHGTNFSDTLLTISLADVSPPPPPPPPLLLPSRCASAV